MNPVSVIIPVYNAFTATQECLQSVLAHSPARHVRIIAIDDASTEGTLSEFLPKDITNDPRLTVVRNAENRGFTGTCNRGMLVLSGSDDVVLLNSDTVVTARWLEKLQRASKSSKDVGTVTALTNNGIICSIPRFCEDNPLPAGLTLSEFAELVEQVSRRAYPTLPTCVGFCVYIRRELIDTIGGLDEQAFPKGYGEENDFSCRAQAAGFRDIVDDATFIHHKGGMSFGQAQHELRHAHAKTLRDRHPRYEQNVATFCRTNPLSRIHASVWNGLIARDSRTPKPVVLHILHNGPTAARRHGIGGTERHVLDLVKGVNEAHHWTLSPGLHSHTGSSMHLSYFRAGVERTFDFAPGAISLHDILSTEFFDVLHVHHTMGFERSALVDAIMQHGRYIVSLHDHWLICPRAFLLTPELTLCSRHECETSCAESHEGVQQFRSDAKRLLDSASRVISFSEHVKSTFSEFCNVDARWNVVPHGLAQRDQAADGIPPERPLGTTTLKALVMGTIVAHKGLALLQEAIRTSTERGLNIEWHILGTCTEELPTSCVLHGEYRSEDALMRIRQIAPDVAVFLSLAPETFSMTLSEVWAAGIPAVVTPRGALQERVNATGAGVVLPEASASALITTLVDLQNHPERVQQLKERTLIAPLTSLFEECRTYGSVYGALWTAESDTAPMLELIGALEPDLLPPGLRTKSSRRIVARQSRWNLRELYEGIRKRRTAVEERLHSGPAR